MATTNKKPTKRDHFTTLLTYAEVKANPDMVAFIEHEIELLNKKNSAEKKPTAQQTANESIKEVILDVLGKDGGLMTVTDVQKSTEELADLSNQRISALLRQLIADGYVERVKDKRKAYFKLA